MSDTPIESVLPIFADKGIDVAFLVPTETGMKKSIMDAIAPFREFLKAKGIHDYERQDKGTANKKTVPTYIVNPETPNHQWATATSLYRPETKQGDPRIWISGLTKFANPWNLLGIVSEGTTLYVFNLSDSETLRSLRTNYGFAANILKRLLLKDEAIANELLEMFRNLHRMGFVQTITSGDTGVGMTAEHFLGIPPNPLKAPDYKGIEIKCSRKKQTTPNRVNLYSQVPDWRNSRGMTAKRLLSTYGYWAQTDKGRRFNLYCTVEAHRPNPQSLYFEVDDKQDILINMSDKTGKPEYVLQWSLQTLRERLLEKHRETFWVKAESKIIGGLEYFRYDNIVHTKKPNTSLFSYLIDIGIITMDYTMHFKPNGTVRDHGYLFKIKPGNVNMLFPEPITHIL